MDTNEPLPRLDFAPKPRKHAVRYCDCPDREHVELTLNGPACATCWRPVRAWSEPTHEQD